MGLTLHYDLRLPASTPNEEVDRILAALRERAHELRFEFVSPVATVQPRPQPSDADDRPGGWLGFFASLIAEPYGEDRPALAGDVATARGFLVNPGEGCESATFGFLLRADATGSAREWFWQCSCKTQYASVVSDAHFVSCHTSLVSLLDHAVVLGVDVTVYDETGYWETRDERQLTDEVHRMNRLVAALAGRLADAIGPEHAIRAPIFEHRRFERLEMAEVDELDLT